MPKFSTTYQPEKNGRHKMEIDEALLEDLASIDCTVAEISAVMGVSPDLIQERFSGILNKGRGKGKCSMKRLLHKKAHEGDLGAMIWLSKQTCGYRDKPADAPAQVHFNVTVNEIPT